MLIKCSLIFDNLFPPFHCSFQVFNYSHGVHFVVFFQPAFLNDSELNSVSFALSFSTPFGMLRVVFGRSSPLACAEWHAAAFALNAAPVASQCRHSTTRSLHQPSNAEHETG